MIQISAGALILLATGILLLPARWLLSAITAGLIHEFFHIISVYLLGGRIHSIEIHGGGAVIDAFVPDSFCDICSIAAGPLGSLLLIFLGKQFPELAVCGAVQGIFNLLPVYPLDGGRMLRHLIGHLLPGRENSVQAGICAVLMILVFITLFLIGSEKDLLLAGTAVFCLIRKTPCKPT